MGLIFYAVPYDAARLYDVLAIVATKETRKICQCSERIQCTMWIICSLILSFRATSAFVVDRYRHNDNFLLPTSPGNPSYDLKATTRRSHRSGHSLFFTATEESPLLPCKSVNKVVSPNIYNGLSSGRIQLPYRSMMEVPDALKKEGDDDNAAILTVRLMELRDVRAITELCVEEYCCSSNDSSLGDWIERLSLRILVDATMRMKLRRSASDVPSDHAVIVASISNERMEQLVGMIEVSRQPVLPDCIPPPVPIPLSLKQTYCQLTQTPLEAWIANLLVKPTARGLGLSKLLVAAAEGVSRGTWHCRSIHLHCDADGISGKIPQRLYKTLGYEPGDPDPSGELSWLMSSSNLSNSVHVIQGVPLLHLKRDFVSLDA